MSFTRVVVAWESIKARDISSAEEFIELGPSPNIDADLFRKFPRGTIGVLVAVGLNNDSSSVAVNFCHLCVAPTFSNALPCSNPISRGDLKIVSASSFGAQLSNVASVNFAVRILPCPLNFALVGKTESVQSFL
jgi:hypothetical protein